MPETRNETPNQAMIEVEALSRVYSSGPKSRPAVDGISFRVSRGEVLGFLGPNGAGKSTTMKMLTCFLPPSSGRARVAGFDVYDEPFQVRRNIGYLPEETPLYRDMTVLGYLQFAAELRGVPVNERKACIRRIGEVTGIMDVLGKYVRELSRGYRQRVGLTQAMLHDPPVLILDEPTSGLDPNQIVEIRELIREIGKEKTVILSTHILTEVQATCSRVLIINEGKLVADGTPEDLISRETSNTYRLLLSTLTAPAEPELRTKLEQLPGVDHLETTPSEPDTIQFQLRSKGTQDLRTGLFRLAADSNWPLLELDRREPSLEAVFGRLTRTTHGEGVYR